MQEKSVVLIDGGNILNGWMSYCKDNHSDAKIDYVKLVHKLSEGTNLLRGYFYDGVPEILPTTKKNFLEALQRHGIQLRTRVLKLRRNTCTSCGNVDVRNIQKGVDVSLATDILRHAWQGSCSICIVVSGDEDYKDAIECAKDKGVQVWVASFRNCLSPTIWKAVDKVIFIEDIFEEVKMTLAKERYL